MGNNKLFIILSRPQMGENIGAAARAMKNFGVRNLRIISPRDGWPNEKAISSSAGASDLIESAQIFDSLQDAIADLEYVYATTGIRRDLNKDYVLAKDLSREFPFDSKVGILFGQENWGLNNEDISYANKIVTIDTDPEFCSLNLAQGVLVICYELFKRIERNDLANNQDLASKEDLGFFCDHLFEILESKEFFRIPEKEDRMKRNIRNIFSRIDKLSKNEMQTLRGVLSSLK